MTRKKRKSGAFSSMNKRSRKLFLTNDCLTPLECIHDSAILCENDRIIATGGGSAFSLSEPGLEIIRVENAYAVPGFIDSHIHGIDKFDASDPLRTEYDLAYMSRELTRHGITTFFPTVISRPREEMIRTVAALAAMMDKGCLDADAPGMHIEGPFINPEKRGSQDIDCICNVDLGYARDIIAAGNGRIKLMTFAPELENAEELIGLMLENGIIPSMGHSLAEEKQTLRAIDAGARRCTYIFNGMPLLHHRDSTLTTIALTDNRVAVEMIVDGAHIHPRMVDIVSRIKPKDKLIGISNAVTAPRHGSGNSSSDLIKNLDGIITGTTMTLDSSWLRLVSYSHMPHTEAAACFTSNPAADLGLITRGEIKPGKRADITFFDSKTNQVRMTVSRGNIIYDADSSSSSFRDANEGSAAHTAAGAF